ncbi:MAG: anthranilate synthase component I family protein [Spirochaetales bacterium]|nr:anthranilate synthase component I family protein [Spirochaetales bacterium]
MMKIVEAFSDISIDSLIYNTSLQENCVILDSSSYVKGQGEFIYLCVRPVYSYFFKDNIFFQVDRDGERIDIGENLFDYLNQFLKDHYRQLDSYIGFCGGLAGYFGYELKDHIFKFKDSKKSYSYPDLFLGVYDTVVAIDLKSDTRYICANGLFTDQDIEIEEIISLLGAASSVDLDHVNLTESGFFSEKIEEIINSDFFSDIDKSEYFEKVQSVKAAIYRGDIYQANFTRRLIYRGQENFDLSQLYLLLRRLNPAPFSAFVKTKELTILCSSPERFVKVVGKLAQTSPIKGTIKRSSDPEVDLANKKALESSHKDRAELLMITDLLRNDFNRVCEPGSVVVRRLLESQSFKSVHHLVSDIYGRIPASLSSIDLFRNCFPGGSITGAPKIRAMEIIEELEPVSRGLYTGSVAYFDFSGNMDTNIVIRTIFSSEQGLALQTGGGIVFDSELDQEFEETIVKAASLVTLFKKANEIVF